MKAHAKSESGLEALGSKLRARRRELGMTLLEVATGSNLTPGFISQVERNLVSPSLSSLAAISNVLQSNISEFLAMPVGRKPSTKDRRREKISMDDGNLSYERISASFPQHVLNGVIMHSAPGRASEPIKHEGEELFYVLKGSITAIVDGKHTILNEGDSMHFVSQKRHSTFNHTDRTASVLIICTMDVFGETSADGALEIQKSGTVHYFPNQQPKDKLK